MKKWKKNLYCSDFFYLNSNKNYWCDIKVKKSWNILKLIGFWKSENKGRELGVW